MIEIKLNYTPTKFQYTCLSHIPLHKNNNILHWLHQSSVQISTGQARYWRTSPQTRPESRTTKAKELQLCAVAMDTARLSSTTLQWQKDNEHWYVCTSALQSTKKHWYTVEPVYNGHLWEMATWPLYTGWPLYSGPLYTGMTVFHSPKTGLAPLAGLSLNEDL